MAGSNLTVIRSLRPCPWPLAGGRLTSRAFESWCLAHRYVRSWSEQLAQTRGWWSGPESLVSATSTMIAARAPVTRHRAPEMMPRLPAYPSHHRGVRRAAGEWPQGSSRTAGSWRMGRRKLTEAAKQGEEHVPDGTPDHVGVDRGEADAGVMLGAREQAQDEGLPVVDDVVRSQLKVPAPPGALGARIGEQRR